MIVSVAVGDAEAGASDGGAEYGDKFFGRV